jgi:hypothetical protein
MCVFAKHHFTGIIVRHRSQVHGNLPNVYFVNLSIAHRFSACIVASAISLHTTVYRAIVLGYFMISCCCIFHDESFCSSGDVYGVPRSSGYHTISALDLLQCKCVASLAESLARLVQFVQTGRRSVRFRRMYANVVCVPKCVACHWVASASQKLTIRVALQ